MIHTVRTGETLYSIAQNYNISQNDIARINNITNPNEISVGQNLFIPLKRITSYQVKRGDTLYSIARANGILLNCQPTNHQPKYDKHRRHHKHSRCAKGNRSQWLCHSVN